MGTVILDERQCSTPTLGLDVALSDVLDQLIGPDRSGHALWMKGGTELSGRTSIPSVSDCTTLGDEMDRAAVVFGSQEAYVDGLDRMTFAQWDSRSRELAVVLSSRGIGPGDVVALMLSPGIPYAVAYVAIVRLGAVVTGLNTRLGRLEVDQILEQCAPALVIYDQATGLPAPVGHPLVYPDGLTDAGAGSLPPAPWSGTADAPAVIIWTSGTTGHPKGAWFDHAGLAAAVASSGAVGGYGQRRLVPTPFAHAGYMAKVWEQLATGTTFVLAPQPWTAESTARVLVEEQITVAGAVPTQWEKLLDLPGLTPSNLPHLRIGVAATAAASPELIKAVRRKLGCPLVVRYAMTESPSITGTEPDDSTDVAGGTVGRPQRGMSVRIVDADGKPMAAGGTGEVQVRGTCVMRGYWNDPDTTALAFDGGWLRTGDLGRLDEHENLVLAGRSRDMYIRGGYNVYPLEVENVLATHPAVAKVSVVGMPARVIGEIGAAFVVPVDPATPPTLDDLRGFVREHLADYKRPDELVLVDELPLTPMMKVDKNDLRRRFTDVVSNRSGARDGRRKAVGKPS